MLLHCHLLSVVGVLSDWKTWSDSELWNLGHEHLHPAQVCPNCYCNSDSELRLVCSLTRKRARRQVHPRAVKGRMHHAPCQQSLWTFKLDWHPEEGLCQVDTRR